MFPSSTFPALDEKDRTHGRRGRNKRKGGKNGLRWRTPQEQTAKERTTQQQEAHYKDHVVAILCDFYPQLDKEVVRMVSDQYGHDVTLSAEALAGFATESRNDGNKESKWTQDVAEASAVDENVPAPGAEPTPEAGFIGADVA